MTRVLFDVTRLIWRARRNSPTGIDRVLEAYADWLSRQERFETVPVALAGEGLVRVSDRRWRSLLAGLTGAGSPSAWSALTEALQAPAPVRGLRLGAPATAAADLLGIGGDILLRRATRMIAPAPKGDLYINVAHTGLDRPGLLAGVAASGARVVVMVHDLIPITHPEYCTPESGAKHRRRIDHVLGSASLVVANSAATAADFCDYARSRDRSPPPVQVAPLGLAPAFTEPAQDPVAPTRPYFVCVGTLEARKNLTFLLTVWTRLAERLGDRAPTLVLVGRRGWENESVVDQLDRAPAAVRLVHEVSDLSDAHLAHLLAGANGLLAPSFAEGFDLPVAEALARGTPVIASDIAVHRELAGRARLIDPLDGPAWLSAIETATGHRGNGPIAAGPTWSEHFALVGTALGALAREAAP